jgi:hypothetical protein
MEEEEVAEAQVAWVATREWLPLEVQVQGMPFNVEESGV